MISEVIPDPSSTSIGEVTINFSEPVTGVDVADFELTLDGTAVDLSVLTVSEVSPDEYTLDLSTVTTVEGSYELALIAADSGIESLNGVPLVDDTTETFAIDFPVPTAVISEVIPDPSSTSIGEVTINFSEPVTGVDAADFELTLDGTAVDLSALSLTEVSPDEYTLDLSTVTTVAGSYELTLIAADSGIASLNGVLLVDDATDAFVVDFPVPTAAIAEVIPDPSSTSIGEVTINFSEPVTGVDLADFELTLDSVTVDLSGLTVSEVSPDEYTLDLSTVTDDGGSYVLTLVAADSGIESLNGVPLAADATESFGIDQTAPTATIVVPQVGGAPVNNVQVTFDENVTGVVANVFELTRDGVTVDLAGLTIDATSASEYILDLSAFTVPDGVYDLTLAAAGSGITDGAGNAIEDDTTSRFVVAAQRVEDDLQVLYTFDVDSGSTVFDVSGVGVPLDLQIDDPANVSRHSGSIDVTSPARISSAGAATKVIEAVDASGEITIEAWITPANTSQTGPARIVGISSGTFTANFNLGQNKTRYDAKLRTTSTNLNGNPATVTSTGTVSTSLTHVAYTRGSDGEARLYVDGVLTASRTTSGTFGNWDPSYPLAIANTMNDTKPWLGELDLVAVYSGALSESEVLQNFAAGPDPILPLMADIADISPDPRDVPVTDVTITFTMPVSGVDIGDFVLTKDGDPVDISNLQVVEVAPDEYTIDLKTVTDEDGAYELTLVADGSEIETARGVPITGDVSDAFDVDVLDTPIRTRIVDVAGNGKPIVEFYALDPTMHVITHDGSGDTQSISSDGRYVALFASSDFNVGDWYVYEFETGIFTLIGERIPGTPAAGFNFRFMWGPEGNDYVLIEEAAGGGPELVSRDVAGTLHWTRTLPTTLPSPDAFDDGNAPVFVSWRGGEAGGEEMQILGAIAFVNNQSYLWIQPFDATTGAFLPDSGFWIVDNSDGLATSCHNCFVGLGGVVYSPSTPFFQQFNYWAPYDGSQFIRLDPDDLPLLHQTVDGNEILYATIGGATIFVDEYPEGATGPDNDGDGVPDRTTLLSIDRTELLPFFPGTTNPAQVSYWHGHLDDGMAVISVIKYNVPSDLNDDEFVLLLLDVSDGSLSLILDPQQYENSGFYSQPRPTISLSHEHACWHNADEDGGIVSTFCINV